MPKMVQAYRCNYCEATFLNVTMAEEQEQHCLFNPNFECCENCENMVIAVTPRFSNESTQMKVCQTPPGPETDTETNHNYGWCSNYSRNKSFDGGIVK